MASTWAEPLPFIESKNGKLVVNPETAKRLAEVHKPVISVAIAGVYRTGKSYLMNRLARRRTGFPLGNTVQSKTKGIWIWYCEHPIHSDKAIFLLDTEGLSDPEKGDNQHDMAIFSISVLLCTMFIFNAIGKIDQDMINKLYFVSELTDAIRVRRQPNEPEDESESDYDEFSKYFPCFVLAVRDFMLDLVIGNKTVTADQYFDEVLQLKKGNSSKVTTYNRPREAIRNAFRSHHCFVFPRPVEDDDSFDKLEELSDADLSPQFHSQTILFCDFVFKNGKEKKIFGKTMNGRLFVRMTEQYVEAINNGAVPCIESTATLVAERENKLLQEESLKFYWEQMNQIPLPVILQELSNSHKLAYDLSMEHFREKVVFDEKRAFTDVLMQEIENAYAEIVTRNKEASSDLCRELISSLYERIMGEKIKNHQYTCPGGYLKYEADLQQLKAEYETHQGKGEMAEIEYNNFIQQKQGEREAILAADTNLTEKEKEAEAANKAREAAETESRLKAEALEAERKRINDMENDHKEQLEKLKEESQKQLANRTKEMQDSLDAKMAEQRKLLQQGFDEKAKQMQNEIQRLIDENKPSPFEQFLGAVTTIANPVGMLGLGGRALGGVCDGIGSGIKSIGRVFRV